MPISPLSELLAPSPFQHWADRQHMARKEHCSQYYALTLLLDIVHKTVMVPLHPRLLIGCLVLASLEATKDMPAPVYCGVHAVHSYNI